MMAELPGNSKAWFTIFILTLWAISAYMDYKRKKKLRAARYQQQEQQQQQTDEMTKSPKVEVLEEAESQAKESPYQSVSHGPNLEVRLRDLLASQGIPLETEEKDPTEPPVPEKKPNTLLPPPVEEKRFSMADSSSQTSSAPSQVTRLGNQNAKGVNWFPGGIRQAIIASEILQPPKGLRGRKKLWPRNSQ